MTATIGCIGTTDMAATFIDQIFSNGASTRLKTYHLQSLEGAANESLSS